MPLLGYYYYFSSVVNLNISNKKIEQEVVKNRLVDTLSPQYARRTTNLEYTASNRKRIISNCMQCNSVNNNSNKTTKIINSTAILRFLTIHVFHGEIR